MLYWPVLANARALPEATLAKIDAYMKQGGMIIFDTKDYGRACRPASACAARAARRCSACSAISIFRAWSRCPEHHVLTKSFYLLRSFPGRWDGGQLWVEAEAPARQRPGPAGPPRRRRELDPRSPPTISPRPGRCDDRGQPLYPVVPGGERQREMAFRTGVNIVMYALTGNYKADQVHVPALLERLGQ